jgi:hypothetical protein
LWKDKRYFIKYFDQVGFERTLAGTTTDLGIPNRKRIGVTLEGGLLLCQRLIETPFLISQNRAPHPSFI